MTAMPAAFGRDPERGRAFYNNLNNKAAEFIEIGDAMAPASSPRTDRTQSMRH